LLPSTQQTPRTAGSPRSSSLSLPLGTAAISRLCCPVDNRGKNSRSDWLGVAATTLGLDGLGGWL
jgi:hypothetical protein